MKKRVTKPTGARPFEWAQSAVSQIHPPIVPTMSSIRHGAAEKSELLLWKWMSEDSIEFHPCFALIKLHHLALCLIQVEETGELFWVDPTELIPTEAADEPPACIYRDGVDFTDDPGTPPDLR